MKILSSLVGLILFLAGIYLSYWVFLDFESFETLYIGVYLGGSFVLMTLGFFLFLLPLAWKKKELDNKHINKESISNSFNPQNSLSDAVNEENEISEGDAITIIQDTEIVVSDDIDINEDVSVPLQEIDNIDYAVISEEIDLASLDQSKNRTYAETEAIEATPINQAIINLNKDGEEKQNHEDSNPLDEIASITQTTIEGKYENIELRVIGIDSWSSQSILRKLTEQSHLELNQKAKSGINMTQVTFNNKIIGYLSRLDMNKISHKLDLLVEITTATQIKDGRKTKHFSINLKFKLKDNSNE